MEEKKESWIEKLVELLNEYRTEKLRKEMYVNWADKEAIELSEAERINEYEISQTLDSQNYLKSFVRWLVENEKIDLESYCRITSVERKWEEDVYRDEYESLLMLLSIQDNPIEFLISILK